MSNVCIQHVTWCQVALKNLIVRTHFLRLILEFNTIFPFSSSNTQQHYEKCFILSFQIFLLQKTFLQSFKKLIFGCAGSPLLRAGFLQWQQAGATLQLQCTGFLLQWLLLWSPGSWALEHGLSSCGIRAQVPYSMWNLPGPGIKPVSPKLNKQIHNH